MVTQEEFTIADKSVLSVKDVQDAVRAAWADLRVEGSTARQLAIDAGIDIDDLPDTAAGFVDVKPAAAGIAGVDLIILAASHAAVQLWQHVLLPQIRERWGDKAIAKKNAAATAAAKKAAAAAKKSSN
jgi:hypothetical protein